MHNSEMELVIGLVFICGLALAAGFLLFEAKQKDGPQIAYVVETFESGGRLPIRYSIVRTRLRERARIRGLLPIGKKVCVRIVHGKTTKSKYAVALPITDCV
ncbi:MAG: hypothetical protein AAGH74_07435 [Pseudomonadota bacterium]